MSELHRIASGENKALPVKAEPSRQENIDMPNVS
jgi:hypothetical protein